MILDSGGFLFCLSQKMITRLSTAELNVIEACFTEKGWTPSQICREFQGKRWKRRQVERAVKRLKDTGSIHYKKPNGQPKIASTDENVAYVEEHCESQESDGAPADLSCKQIARNISISKSTVSRIIKRSNRKSVKCYDAPQMPPATEMRRLERSRGFLKRLPKWRTNQIVFQDEKDFFPQVPSNRQNNRIYIWGTKDML